MIQIYAISQTHLQIRRRFLELGDFLCDLLFKIGFHFDLFISVKKEIGFFHIIKQAHQPEVFIMGDWIIFVGVTLGTTGGQSHPDGAGGGHRSTAA